MNYSAIWNAYEKMMAKKIIKTADKDKNYDIKIPSAGENMPVEKSGYDLIEGIAHPEQVQVGESQVNDAIVERDTDTQRIMVDVALRNPRGVLADIMNSLIKVASKLEENPTEQNLKIAEEIDMMLEKIAQQEFYNPEQSFEALVSATQTAVNELKDVHWGSFFGLGAGGKPQEAVENFTTKLQRYLNVVKVLKPEQKKKWQEAVSAIVLTDGPGIKNYVEEYGKKGLFGPADALKAVRDLIDQASVSAPTLSELNQDKLPSDELAQRMPTTTTIPSVKPEETKTMPLAYSGRHYSVGGPANEEAAEKVKELQRLVGAEDDGKFGPQTFEKVMETAQKEGHTGLGEYMHSLTLLQKGYENWDLNAVIHAILAIKRFNQTKQDPFEKVETPAVEALRQKYPDVQVYHNQIYPFGYGGASYALNQSNIDYLANASENLASKYIKEQGEQNQPANVNMTG